ncbi:hypothetical protein [Maribacter sp. 2307UL18-2]|uniref:hypothetical protein n=1 Tax=Maribacter sp. 2307UL18-2 TaxID=3386274 RepID=UPI0039BCCD51
MRYLQITLVYFGLILFLSSCRESISEQHNSPTKQSHPAPSAPEKIGTPVRKDSIKTPTRTQKDLKIKKEKKRASDTLRPKVAVL